MHNRFRLPTLELCDSVVRMMRPRFSSGLVVGLACGLPVGALIVLFVLPPRSPTSEQHTQAIEALREEVAVLREKPPTAGSGAAEIALQDALTELTKDRESTKAQLDLFRELANQVSANLSKVEKRLDSIEQSADQARRAANQRPAPRYGSPQQAPAEPRRYRDEWD